MCKPAPKIRELPRKVCVRKVAGPLLKLPKDIPKSQGTEEYLADTAYSSYFVRPNHKGWLTVETKLNVMIFGCTGIMLIRDSKGKTHGLERPRKGVCLLPGTHEIMTLNLSGLRSDFWMFMFDDAAAQLWSRWGYYIAPVTIKSRPMSKDTAFTFTRIIDNPERFPPGIFATKLIMSGFPGFIDVGFFEFLKAGPLRDCYNSIPPYDPDAIINLPHLEYLEGKRRKKLTEQRILLHENRKFDMQPRPQVPYDPNDPCIQAIKRNGGII